MIRSLTKSPSLGEFGFSLLTVFLALIVGGLAMAFTGANPLGVYKDLVVGAGFDWPFHLIPGNPLGVEPLLAENNLVATLVHVHAARADGLRRRLRVPLRALQHRRHGPVLGRIGVRAARGAARRQDRRA